MEYYREYVEVSDPDDGGPPYTAEIKLCHNFPITEATGGNRVIVLDPRVEVSDVWDGEDMPTETWAVAG